ncbi:MAG: 4-hydroxythreonine-4-phosphate dehydrogenase PdxA [Alphaproteobacteria bacterium]
MTPPIAVTMGEPAGIGPDILLDAWRHRNSAALPSFYAIADPALLHDRAKRLGWDVPLREVAPQEAGHIFDEALPVLPIGLTIADRPGEPVAATAQAVIETIRRAVQDVTSGDAVALVTNPIAKFVLAEAGFPHPGHTEFLGQLAAGITGSPARPVMMIWSEQLAVVPVTIHMPLADVPKRLTTDLIVETAVIVDKDLRSRFGFKQPRLAICGLNPHAGEGGLLGHEEETTITPAIQTLVSRGIAATGPHAADTLFHAQARSTYDVAIGMYHDQVLAPIKTIAFDDGVNVTLGLPFIRTSPDHGTAFPLAGTGNARPHSLIAAIRLAGRLATTSS